MSRTQTVARLKQPVSWLDILIADLRVGPKLRIAALTLATFAALC